MSLGGDDGSYDDGGTYDVGGTGTTRTHLPDAGDAYASPRRPARSSRSLVTVVGVVVLLIAAIAFANQGGGEGSGDGSGSDGSKPGGNPTAASGEKPVSGDRAGIPSGFAHNAQGAQSAAANYAVVLGGDGMFNTATRHEIVDTLYTKQAVGELKGPMDKAYSPEFLAKMGLDENGKAPEGSTFVSRTMPVGTKTVKSTADSATVEVWYTGLIGMSGTNSTDPVRTTWKTWTFELTWSDDDWRIVKDNQTDGPTPVPGDESASTSKEISEAVEEYGGFTYAR
ncbi:hypothetical protein ACIBI4_33470 [Streptomyces sp. NPDC050418]|uniref:hypothetical protein n=1 Tax=Streptomyces sp. NPDC050418 TaxID=3365612 RepID=UPI0037B8030E